MLIAFHSQGRFAGKDTAGEAVRQWCGEQDPPIPYERRAFGDKMKLLIAEALDIRAETEAETIARIDKFKLNGFVEYVVLPSKKRWTIGRISGRDFIINLAGDSNTGENGARKLFGNNFWTDQALPATTDHQDRCVAITDLRSNEEADLVHELGGVVVQIHRKEAEKGRSEQGIDPDKVDYQMWNHFATAEEWQNEIKFWLECYAPDN